MSKRATAGYFYGDISVDPETVRGEVFAFIQKKGAKGATCDEVEAGLYLTHQTASARVNELAKSRVIVDSGEKRVTRNYRKARVYRVNEFADVYDVPATAPAASVPVHASAAW